MKKSYDTLVEAMEAKRQQGYTIDFNLDESGSKCVSGDIHLHPEDFTIKEVHRFEGMSNPDDSSVLYVIESKDGCKGMLVDAYGAYSNALNPEMIQKLKRER